ncbi:MAG TPA: hypothetical protein VMS87_08470 [Roseiarcus sp.]|nr:hypothetical protein [Roseiarcus sp.]
MFEQGAFRSKIVTALLLSLLVATPGAALAQGSAGGSIGNDEKSLSGARPEPRSVEPARPTSRTRSQESEPRRSASRSGGGGGFDGAWVVVSVGCGGSTTGAVVVSSGRIIGEGVVSGHVSPNGAASAVGNVGNGVTVMSSGHLSSRSGSGSFRRSDGCSGRWTASKQ